ncbi:MAG: DUF3305 domain-containing protein [Bradyrhizobium sp.]
MTAVTPSVRIPVGVVVERRTARSPWLDVVWLPVAVLSDVPETEPWSSIAEDDAVSMFSAGPAEIELYRSETGNYRDNLASGAPSVWISLHATGGDPPFIIAAVTADPAEGEALTEPGNSIVEAVTMSEPIRHAIAAFVAEHYVENAFEKRKRDRADLEALARGGSQPGKGDERS